VCHGIISLIENTTIYNLKRECTEGQQKHVEGRRKALKLTSFLHHFLLLINKAFRAFQELDIEISNE
jgi:hypothetical protein